MDEFLTVSEAAPKTKMSEQSLYSAIREGQFPAIRIGRRIRIPLSKLERWIETNGSLNEKLHQETTAEHLVNQG